MSTHPHASPTLNLTLDLNPAQAAAVEHGDGPLLVVAGAGSGKTRVLTARVERLLARGVPPDAILAFTFTNRAAREMRERLERAAGAAAARLWVGTFHATAVRVLRRESGRAGIPRDFTIYDREDQESVLKAVMRRLELPEATYRMGVVLGRISDAKNALATPADMARTAASPWEKRVAEVYEGYDAALRANGALDFDDLIAGTVRLLRDDPDVAERWGRRFHHVLVDEYQDTNHAQFLMIQALSARHGNLFVVGDDDQSIYGWRGADLRNVLDFERAFPGAAVIRLEQNYRSTGNILRAANAVIANNRARKGKNLWCDREDGARLRFVLAQDEADEARRVRAFLEEVVARGGRYDGCAVLYRTNAQSRAFETEFRHRGIPYEIVGGVAFYQRREVKDVLAYLRVAVQPADAVAFWRIWNTPRRGLGGGARALVEERMSRDGLTPPAALAALHAEGAFRGAARGGTAALLALLETLAGMREAPLEEVFRTLLERSGYLESLAEEGEGAEERRANVEELVAGALGWAAAGGGALAEFLAETALLTDADRVSEGRDRVLLLTAHNGKGLEFPVVVVAGLEEGLMPHASASQEEAEMEEERRLFYVALTRARDQVLLSAAAYRRRFDGPRGGTLSRFLDEIPAELLDRDLSARRGRFSDDGGAELGADSGWGGRRRRESDGHAVESVLRATRARHSRAVGREVFHESFGRGRVLEAEGEGSDAKYTVQFASGVRRILGRFLSGGGGDDPA